MYYPLSSNTWDEEEAQVFRQVLEKGRFTMGECVNQLETAFARKFGVKYAVMVSSGSMANLVGTAALFYKKDRPLKRGDEVIVPAISWATTYYPLQQYGLKLKFLDVELDTLNMDVSQLEKAITSKTRMVLAVSILGNPCALDTISAFCQKHGLYLFEDNCESMGAELSGKYCGTFGDINTFSTFFSHHISTMEGGFIATDDEEMYHLAKSLRAHGWTRDLPPESPVHKKGDDEFYEAYRFILPGYNARPLELSGAIGIEQLKKLDSMIAIRRKNAEVFVNLFSEDDRFIIQKENGKSSWFSFTIILNPKYSIDRSAVMEAMRKADIEFRIITGGCFLRHDVIKYFDYETVGDIVNANIAHDQGFFVGNHPRDLRQPLERLREVLETAVRS
ncbi:pyridoxamine 5-phosphate oxidase [Candidatus Nitromaritima sp. SCGC AAA799-A02]|nr:pyridoxamine 5-phosphate oxidase [Candidatus Nitromaritima sp. SCGC AAA799-A02]